jgi:hypothetical protein
VKRLCTQFSHQEELLKKHDQALVSLLGASSLGQETPPSASVYGAQLWEILEYQRHIFSPSPSNAEPIFSDELMAALDTEKEAEFINTCFSRLQELLDDRLVSSEDFRWLPTAGSARHDQKPDLIVLHPAFYTSKKSGKRNYVCGIPSSPIFFKELKVIDVKLRDPNTAFGEHVIHLNHLYDNISNNSGEPIVTRGAVADKSGIRLVECLMRAPISVMSVQWTDKGGAKAFSDFFKKSSQDLEKTNGFILNEVCKDLNVLIVESKPDECEPCFLGAGAMGKVFKVQDREQNQYALKIVLGESDTRMLRREHAMLGEICSANPTSSDQFTVIADKYCEIRSDKTIVGAGFLMKPVGKPMNRKDPNHFQLGLKALLKLHKLSRYHGDARAANMLLSNGHVILCDLRDACQNLKGNLTDYQYDISTILRSFKIDVDSKFQEWLEQYDPLKENAEEIIGNISGRVSSLLST